MAINRKLLQRRGCWAALCAQRSKPPHCRHSLRNIITAVLNKMLRWWWNLKVWHRSCLRATRFIHISMIHHFRSGSGNNVELFFGIIHAGRSMILHVLKNLLKNATFVCRTFQPAMAPFTLRWAISRGVLPDHVQNYAVSWTMEHIFGFLTILHTKLFFYFSTSSASVILFQPRPPLQTWPECIYLTKIEKRHDEVVWYQHKTRSLNYCSCFFIHTRTQTGVLGVGLDACIFLLVEISPFTPEYPLTVDKISMQCIIIVTLGMVGLNFTACFQQLCVTNIVGSKCTPTTFPSPPNTQYCMQHTWRKTTNCGSISWGLFRNNPHHLPKRNVFPLFLCSPPRPKNFTSKGKRVPLLL